MSENMPECKIRKAVIPAAGLGTRMLPTTKAIPKEMLPVFDKPLIHYAVSELFNAGIESILIVTGLGKHVIENHFARDSALEQELIVNGKIRELENIKNNTPVEGSIAFVRQSQRLGLGHAVWCARKWIGEEPFFVSTPDELLLAEISCVKQMLDEYQKINNPEVALIAAMEMEKKQTQNYGVLEPVSRPQGNSSFQVKGLVEKPKPENAPSNFCAIGRYILPAKIIGNLELAVINKKMEQSKHSKSDNNSSDNNQEIQLTDAIASFIEKKTVAGYLYKGERYDCGKIGGWVAANVAVAKQRIEKQKMETQYEIKIEGGLAQKDNEQNKHWQQTIDALDKIENHRK